jgi:hypothetical protein
MSACSLSGDNLCKAGICNKQFIQLLSSSAGISVTSYNVESFQLTNRSRMSESTLRMLTNDFARAVYLLGVLSSMGAYDSLLPPLMVFFFPFLSVSSTLPEIR